MSRLTVKALCAVCIQSIVCPRTSRAHSASDFDLVAVAEEECDEESDPEIFECENGCGFEDVTISIVESHEKVLYPSCVTTVLNTVFIFVRIATLESQTTLSFRCADPAAIAD